MNGQHSHTVPKQVFLLRHAENEREEGVDDPPLSAEGRRKAAEIGRYIGRQAVRPPLLIVSSFLERALQTASIIDYHLPASMRDKTHILPVTFLHETVFERVIAMTSPFISRLDNLQSHLIRYPEPGAVGTLVVVGHRRSMVLDFMEMVMDYESAIARGEALDRGESELWPEYGFAQLTHWRLNGDRWADFAESYSFATKITEEKFERGRQLEMGPLP